MKQFIAFIKKEVHHILRDRRTILILLCMPIVQIVLFGFALSTEVKDVQTAVLAPSIGTDTRKIIDRLDASEYFTVKYIVHSPDELEQLFRQNKIELAVVFPRQFDRQRMGNEQLQILTDATDPNQGINRSTYASGVIAKARATLRGDTGKTSTLQVRSQLLFNPQMRSTYNFVPGVMGLILMLICAMMTSISIVREKETGTMEVLLVSPVQPIFIILSKTVPYLVLSLLNLTTILLLSVFVLDVPIAGSLAGLISVSFLFIFVSLALGLLISCVTQTQIAALLGSVILLMMPTLLLSGLIFPIESMPKLLQIISCMIPARWYISLVRQIMIEGVPMWYVWKEILILIGMGGVLIVATARQFKNRLE